MTAGALKAIRGRSCITTDIRCQVASGHVEPASQDVLQDTEGTDVGNVVLLSEGSMISNAQASPVRLLEVG